MSNTKDLMELLNYARRCKKKTGHERHETLHAADNNATFCGKELNEMWFLESNAGLDPDDVSCKWCRRIMRSNAVLSGKPPHNEDQ
jgi:hypothetical protein